MTTIEPLLKKLDDLRDYSQEAFDEVAKLTILYKNLAEHDPEEFLKLLKETERAFGEELDIIRKEEVRLLLGGNDGTN